MLKRLTLQRCSDDDAWLVTLVFTFVLSGAASAQQEPDPQQASPEIQRMCRQEIRQMCSTGFLPPSRETIQRCVEENREKLSEQPSCFSAAAIAGMW